MSLTCSTDAPATSDRSVLIALSCGDATAWGDTVRRYEGLLRSAARAVLRSDADVDEAVQRTWVLLFRNADRIHESACLPGWLATTARREALAVLRSQQRSIPTEDVAERVSPIEADLAAELMRQEMSRALMRSSGSAVRDSAAAERSCRAGGAGRRSTSRIGVTVREMSCRMP